MSGSNFIAFYTQDDSDVMCTFVSSSLHCNSYNLQGCSKNVEEAVDILTKHIATKAENITNMGIKDDTLGVTPLLGPLTSDNKFFTFSSVERLGLSSSFGEMVALNSSKLTLNRAIPSQMGSTVNGGKEWNSMVMPAVLKQRMQFIVSNFYGTTFLVICSMVIGIVLPTPSQLQLEANAIMNSGWWNQSEAVDDPYNICTWHSIVCNRAESITEITCPVSLETWSPTQFATLNLSVFKNLERLAVANCRLEGTIPPEIGNLPKLTHLDLSNNYLSGEIPPSLGNLSLLERLIISNTNIQSTIPPLLGNLPKLSHLDLSHNQLSSEIPPSLGNLPKLTHLNLSHNYLFGEIPPLLGNLPKLVHLDLSDNYYLEGIFPPSLGNLT
ncbi:hypothetical protein Fmac_017640 [Flemingia macrophylla]|uniref:Leucine-rich repeat-containing N-terminal plant-type domain-containing protein n=1 Tax=Flemingia macrophylla TaxID=520843 RepID=A0ABD1M2R5_9FABA